MKMIVNNFSRELIKRKKDYTFILGLVLVGITFGAIFMTILDKQDKLLVLNQITSYFDAIKNRDLSYIIALKDNLTSNLLYMVGIWLLGLSVIGIPIILFLIFFKGFIIGFAIASIIYKYHFIGLFITLIYIFPHHLISILITMILGYYALNFSINLMINLFNKKSINFNTITNRYFRILLIVATITIVIGCYEVFVVPTLIKFLLGFIK